MAKDFHLNVRTWSEVKLPVEVQLLSSREIVWSPLCMMTSHADRHNQWHFSDGVFLRPSFHTAIGKTYCT